MPHRGIAAEKLREDWRCMKSQRNTCCSGNCLPDGVKKPYTQTQTKRMRAKSFFFSFGLLNFNFLINHLYVQLHLRSNQLN